VRFGDLLARLRRSGERDRPAAPAPLPPSMAAGADEFQARLDEARERLRRDIPPPDDDE
jgi:hypothetical protein